MKVENTKGKIKWKVGSSLFMCVHSIKKWMSVPFVPGVCILRLQLQITQQDFSHGDIIVVGHTDNKYISKHKFVSVIQRKWRGNILKIVTENDFKDRTPIAQETQQELTNGI